MLEFFLNAIRKSGAESRRQLSHCSFFERVAICCNLHTTDLGYSGGMVDVGPVSNTELAAANKRYNSLCVDKVPRIMSNRSAKAAAGGLI